MRISENYTDWRSAYLRDIEVAEAELTHKNFRNENCSVLCDIYALPAHNHQTFFARIVSERGFYKMIFAKPIQNSIWFHDPIYMYTFDEAKRFEEHPMKQGRIICRARLIDKSLADSVIFSVYKLADSQPEQTVTPTGEAVFTAIRVYEGGRPWREVFYTDAEKLVFSDSTDHFEDVKLLSNLYLKIEKLIGVG